MDPIFILFSISYMTFRTQNPGTSPSSLILQMWKLTFRLVERLIQGYTTIAKTQDKLRILISESEIFNSTMHLLSHPCP